MLPRSDLGSLGPVQTIVALAPLDKSADPRQEAFNRLMQIAVGQQVAAKVISTLADGTSLVRLADTTARMSLPAGVKSGDVLQLTMIDKAARPLFLLASAPDSAPSTFSNGARLLDRLLHASSVAGGTPLAGDKPLIELSPAVTHAAASISAKEIAASLQNALSKSGLFYESHLAQWANGRLPLETIAQEPQARHGMHFQSELPSSSTPADPRHAQIATLVGAQIDALENQRLAWQGEAWPGQPVRWEVGREKDESAHGQAATDPVWQTNVRFALPHLGNVTATIRLCGQRVQMRIQADAPAATVTLKANGAVLADAMAAAGLPLDLLTVRQQADDNA